MSDRYETLASDWQGEPALLLRDHQAGSTALIAPGCGANCVSFTITHAGRSYAVLETPPTPDDLKTRRFRGGIPVLWPFPGRLRDASYSFEGQRYQLPRTDRGGVHHIHGVLNGSVWRVIGHDSSAAGASATCAIGSADLPADMLAGYPFPFEARLTFTLSGAQLTLAFELENQGNGPLPFAYGLHPYFRAPLWAVDSDPLPDPTLRYASPVLIPAASRWPMSEGMPSGPPQPVAPEDDFRSWQTLGAEHKDHTFGDISHSDGWTTAGYRDPTTGIEVLVRADQCFREWVLFTQPNRPSLCIEPYSGLPNAINMPAEGLGDGGLTILAPGNLWRAVVVVSCES